MTLLETLRIYIARKLLPKTLTLASVTAQVDDSPGWGNLTSSSHDYDQGTISKLYADSLTAFRKNPIALRIIGITTSFVIGDSIKISSPDPNLDKFIQTFWNHPKNRLALRLAPMCDELSRAGDLFPILFRNNQDGMSTIRFTTKDRIVKIDSEPNDWETELAFSEQNGTASNTWLSVHNPKAESQASAMLGSLILMLSPQEAVFDSGLRRHSQDTRPCQSDR